MTRSRISLPWMLRKNRVLRGGESRFDVIRTSYAVCTRRSGTTDSISLKVFFQKMSIISMRFLKGKEQDHIENMWC
jgi:hypothetical protein